VILALTHNHSLQPTPRAVRFANQGPGMGILKSKSRHERGGSRPLDRKKDVVMPKCEFCGAEAGFLRKNIENVRMREAVCQGR
jgi:hypothetical protein